MAQTIKKTWRTMTQAQSGFSLLEVLIATTIFAVFASAYVVTQGSNVTEGNQMREEMKLRELCEQKINEIISNPPELRDQLTISKEQKTFEKDSNYEYTLQWFKLEFPDVSQMGGEGDEGESAVNAMVAKKVKDNMEKLLWQLKVTVTNKETKFNYTLSTWLHNTKAEVRLDGI